MPLCLTTCRRFARKTFTRKTWRVLTCVSANERGSRRPQNRCHHLLLSGRRIHSPASAETQSLSKFIHPILYASSKRLVYEITFTFLLLCFMCRQKYKTRRATKRSPFVKIGIGGIFLFLVLFIIWFPLIIFSFTGTMSRPQTPQGCSLSLQLGRYKV